MMILLREMLGRTGGAVGRTGGADCKGATPLPELLEGLILSWAANPHLSSGLVTALRAFMMLTCWD
jgi:hypothetical protein